MKSNRICLSSCSKIKDETDISGNFTSVSGEYFVPGINRTGFYKLNSSFSNNPDLREFLASLLLKKIGVPVADILLVYDDNIQDNGCLSMNILKDGEYFLEDEPFEDRKLPENIKELQGLDRFIEGDLYRCSSKYNFTPELLEERRKFLIQYVFVSAFLGNDDIKTDNCQIIYNSNNGTIRNPEYYDMGMSFSGPDIVSFDNRTRYFFYNQLDMEVLQELYQKYPSEIEDISKRIEISLNKKEVKNLLNKSVFKDLDKETRKKIWMDIGKKIVYISKQNELIYGIKHNQDSFLFLPEEIREVTKYTNISLIDKAKLFLKTLKSKMLGER